MRVLKKTFLAAVITALTIGTAASADFSTVLRGEDGVPYKDELIAQKPDLTLGLVSFHALLGEYKDEPNLPGEEKYRRGELAARVRDAGELQLKAEEVALLKKVVAKAYGPLIVFKTWPLLDPAMTK